MTLNLIKTSQTSIHNTIHTQNTQLHFSLIKIQFPRHRPCSVTRSQLLFRNSFSEQLIRSPASQLLFRNSFRNAPRKALRSRRHIAPGLRRSCTSRFGKSKYIYTYIYIYTYMNIMKPATDPKQKRNIIIEQI